jgi:hypothetical protein
MDSTGFEKSILALALWREDRGAGLDGMIAVGNCLHNRVKTWKQSWSQVVEGKNQLSSMTYLGDSQTIVYPDIREPLFISLIQKIDDIYQGKGTDLSNGGLYYCNPSAITKGGWFEKTIIGNPAEHPICAHAGGHIFYR